MPPIYLETRRNRSGIAFTDPVEDERLTLEVARTILALGVDVNAADDRGNTALHDRLSKEFEDAKSSMLQEFPSNFETAGQLQEQMGTIVAFDLPDDYYGAYERNIEAVSLDDVRRVANERIQSEELTLLIVGDREVIEPGLAELGLLIRYVDHDAAEIGR